MPKQHRLAVGQEVMASRPNLYGSYSWLKATIEALEFRGGPHTLREEKPYYTVLPKSYRYGTPPSPFNVPDDKRRIRSLQDYTDMQESRRSQQEEKWRVKDENYRRRSENYRLQVAEKITAALILQGYVPTGLSQNVTTAVALALKGIIRGYTI